MTQTYETPRLKSNFASLHVTKGGDGVFHCPLFKDKFVVVFESAALRCTQLASQTSAALVPRWSLSGCGTVPHTNYRDLCSCLGEQALLALTPRSYLARAREARYITLANLDLMGFSGWAGVQKFSCENG